MLREIPATVPMRSVGPVPVIFVPADAKGVARERCEELMVPLATFESPLWSSVNRGARVARECGGIRVAVQREVMTRSVILEAPSLEETVLAVQTIKSSSPQIAEVVAGTSRFGRLESLHIESVGRLIYLRVSITTGDAAGHNMVTVAADAVAAWCAEQIAGLLYHTVSGNYCADKKVSAVNGILGRGRHVTAELRVPAPVCERMLRTRPERVAQLVTQKNLLGSSLAGGVRTANAHFANMLLGFYLATGQDAANIVEGSQGFALAEAVQGKLLFSVTVPHVIVGTVGNGKELDFVQSNLTQLGCVEDRPPGENARRLAAICGAVVLCGELSLLAAQANPGELNRAHRLLERKTRAVRGGDSAARTVR